MCIKNNIDEILKQFENCQDSKQMRRLLEEANACGRCPEELQPSGEQKFDCRCRLNFQADIQNTIYTIQTKKGIWVSR